MNISAQLVLKTPRRWSDLSARPRAENPVAARQSRDPKPIHDEYPTIDIRNVGGRLAHGVEIELSGFGDDDVFRAYYLNRLGTPGIMRRGNSIRLRFESQWRNATQMLTQTGMTRTTPASGRSQPYVWEFALYGSGNSERFCIETSTREVIATYRWLVAGESANDSLVADTKHAFIRDMCVCGEMELMAAE